MSFKLLDYINELVVEHTLETPAQTLVQELDAATLPSDLEIAKFQAISRAAVEEQQSTLLDRVREDFKIYKSRESTYSEALRKLPDSIEEVFNQIVHVVTSKREIVPSGWTMAHRNETAGIDNDSELERIWVRMYMLGLIQKPEEA
jgi:hypothetical protein